MDPIVLTALIQAAINIFSRHYAATGEVLTEEQVYERLTKELQDGRSIIAQWFQMKGLPLPQ